MNKICSSLLAALVLFFAVSAAHATAWTNMGAAQRRAYIVYQATAKADASCGSGVVVNSSNYTNCAMVSPSSVWYGGERMQCFEYANLIVHDAMVGSASPLPYTILPTQLNSYTWNSANPNAVWTNPAPHYGTTFADAYYFIPGDVIQAAMTYTQHTMTIVANDTNAYVFTVVDANYYKSGGQPLVARHKFYYGTGTPPAGVDRWTDKLAAGYNYNSYAIGSTTF